MQIASAYTKMAAGWINRGKDGKVYLIIAPATGAGGENPKYDWEKRKNFNLSRSELIAMQHVMETALKKGVAEAQKTCESLLGNGMKSCLFVHVTDHGQAIGGIDLFEGQGVYAPFRFRITFKPKNGNEETIYVGTTRVNAMAIIKDIELFNTEYFRNRLAAEMALEKSETRHFGPDPYRDAAPGIP